MAARGMRRTTTQLRSRRTPPARSVNQEFGQKADKKIMTEQNRHEITADTKLKLAFSEWWKLLAAMISTLGAWGLSWHYQEMKIQELTYQVSTLSKQHEDLLRVIERIESAVLRAPR